MVGWIYLNFRLRIKLPRLLLMTSAVILIMYFFYLLRGLTISFILAAILTFILNPFVSAMERKNTPRLYAILLAYLGLSFILAGLFIYIIPRIIKQLYILESAIPLYITQSQQLLQAIQEQYSALNIPDGIRQIIDQRIAILEESVLQWVRNALGVLISLAANIFKLLLAPVLAFYLLKDYNSITKKAVMLLPENWVSELADLFQHINQVLVSFFFGYFLVACIVGALTAVSMALLGVDFALMLGVVAVFTELIPYFGPFIGAIPAVIIALLQSKWLAFKVVVVYVIIHQLEGNIISPKIMSDKVGIPPLIVILSILAGHELYGLMGMLLAIPCAAVIKVLFCFAYAKIYLMG
jgi:predicted PurR-regulated permease PerM